MPYTFGAGTGDDITWSAGMTLAGTQQQVLVYGWWYPTTLTATRGLWSLGNVIGAEVDTTTSQVRLRTDNTTDGQWTAPVGMVVDTWIWLAFMLNPLNTGPAAAWRVWAGDIINPPAAVTVTQATAPVGNFTGSGSIYVGNKGTGTVAWQGDIAHVGLIGNDSGASDVVNPFALAASGAITAAEEEYILGRFVNLAWLGRYPWLQAGSHALGRVFGGGTGYVAQHNNLDEGANPAGLAHNNLFGPVGLTQTTVTGATVSARRAPRSTLDNPLHQFKRR